MTTPSDRELLEMAAKAAGMLIGEWSDECDAFWCGNAGTTIWNPLTDDGDALRLAVRLRLLVHVWDNAPIIIVGPGNISEDAGSDPYAATRRAIVRAAAEIGRSLP